MSQTQTVTDEGIGELVKLCTGAAATQIKSIVGLTDSSACTAAVLSTYGTPADPKITDSGLSIADCDTISQDTTNSTNDTMTFDHVFTASGTKNVSGVLLCNDDDDCSIAECCFNAVLAMESSDTLTIDGSIVVNQA